MPSSPVMRTFWSTSPPRGCWTWGLQSEGLPQHEIEERARQSAGVTGGGRSVLAGGGR
ncbi:hypothetical protein QBA57_40490 [Streptomyces scabiei]|uniref:hypothetical protein n=1 Tax=Streptomyces scabiei TaxID=1930 RepID=UPI001FF0A757|nr:MULTISPECIES: hypothetical protein [Streptomyces]MDX2627425.1 hypothetical protein [Streptomyces scabiei]MDX3168158.1 hypothetical protein [Streptomyces scabiei]